MKVIFLDIDGVLNSFKTTSRTPSGYRGVSNSLVKRLQKLIKSTGAVVVLTSSWKHSDDMDLAYLYKKLGSAKPVDRTYDPEDRDSRRGAGINAWLESHEVEEFVILDDYSFEFKEQGLMPHLILTDETVGLTDDDTLNAFDVLNGHLIPEELYEERLMWGYHR